MTTRPLEEILFVLDIGCRWRDLPLEMGCGSGHTARRRLGEWQEARVWDRLHQLGLDELSDAAVLDWSHTGVDVFVCGRRGGLTGRNPTGRGKAGWTYHLLCGANCLPLHAMLSAANTHHTMLFGPLLERCGTGKLHADEGYGYRRCRDYLSHRGIKVRIARRGIEDKSKLGRVRWVGERTSSSLLRFKRLGLRYDRTKGTTVPLLTRACTIISIRRLVRTKFRD